MPGADGQQGPRIGVLIVDDHDLYRAGLAMMLQEEPDIEVLAHASRAVLGVRLARELRPDVILMDLRMPDLDGIDATRAIIADTPDARVVALTVEGGSKDVAATIMAGACGYVLKDTPFDDVIGAVRAAATGESWLSPRAATAVLDRVRRGQVALEAGSDALEQLSPREVEILRLVARGLDNREIAAQLHISPSTAKSHLSSVLTKLAVNNRVQAAVYAAKRGLI
jgi:DNA-binding NarL/FixJ family response regulator